MRKAGETSMAGKKGKELARSHNAGGGRYSIRTRSAEKKKNMSSDQGGASTSVVGASTRLDESLWGTLQQHICLADNVYSRLPFEEFFNLRVVCKEWYDIACKRLALKELIQKPFFLILKPFFPLFLKGMVGQLKHGVLSYNVGRNHGTGSGSGLLTIWIV